MMAGMLRVIALVVGAALVTSPSVAMSRSAPAPKSVPSSVLLEYYSRAPGAGRLVVRSSGAAKVVHLRHRARTFRLGTGELSILRRSLRTAPEGLVHAADGHTRDAVFQLR